MRREGELLLAEILKGGNFGRHFTKYAAFTHQSMAKKYLSDSSNAVFFCSSSITPHDFAYAVKQKGFFAIKTGFTCIWSKFHFELVWGSDKVYVGLY